MLIVNSQSMDVYRNLAIEEYLMDQMDDPEPVLFLWQSDCAVVMGKNQNPWRECRLDLMRAEGVPLARRISGGGTVYHDAGNLNYCVLVDRRTYQEQQAFDMVCDALDRFGIRAERTGKSNLSVGGLKFSGNAFCFRKGRAMHHGTLLLSTDLERLNRYLGSMFDGIETHAIASVPAQVGNLELDKEALVSALQDSFIAHYTGSGLPYWAEPELDRLKLGCLPDRHRSSNWVFGATPRFALEVADVHLEVVKDVVVEAGGGALANALVEKRFSDIVFSLVC